MPTTSPRILALRARRRRIRTRGAALACAIFSLAWGVIFYETNSASTTSTPVRTTASQSASTSSPSGSASSSGSTAAPVTSSQS